MSEFSEWISCRGFQKQWRRISPRNKDNCSSENVSYQGREVFCMKAVFSQDCGTWERRCRSHPGGTQDQSHQEENTRCQKTLQVYNMLIGSIKNAWRESSFFKFTQTICYASSVCCNNKIVYFYSFFFSPIKQNQQSIIMFLKYNWTHLIREKQRRMCHLIKNDMMYIQPYVFKGFPVSVNQNSSKFTNLQSSMSTIWEISPLQYWEFELIINITEWT